MYSLQQKTKNKLTGKLLLKLQLNKTYKKFVLVEIFNENVVCRQTILIMYCQHTNNNRIPQYLNIINYYNMMFKYVINSNNNNN